MSEKKVVYVVHSNGRMYMCATPASAAVIPEMENTGDSRAIHVFDASASVSSEPAQSNAFLILTSSRNNTSYKQLLKLASCITLLHLRVHCSKLRIKPKLSRYFEQGPKLLSQAPRLNPSR